MNELKLYCAWANNDYQSIGDTEMAAQESIYSFPKEADPSVELETFDLKDKSDLKILNDLYQGNNEFILNILNQKGCV